MIMMWYTGINYDNNKISYASVVGRSNGLYIRKNLFEKKYEKNELSNNV